MVSSLPRVFFVCIGNAGRSQMAQAFYERRGGEARSAGSRPEREVVLPGKRYVDWNLPDPVVMPLEEVRALRDDIERRVEKL